MDKRLNFSDASRAAAWDVFWDALIASAWEELRQAKPTEKPANVIPMKRKRLRKIAA